MSEVISQWYGRAYHALDVQNRLTIPKGIQHLLQGTFVVFAPVLSIKDEEIAHLIIMPIDDYEDYRERLADHYEGDALDFRLDLLSGYSETMTLVGGKITIDAELCKYAKLDGKSRVVIVGHGNSFKLWSEEKLAERNKKELKKLAERNMQELEKPDGDKGVSVLSRKRRDRT